jgi:arsenite methyltransferase
MSKRRPCSLPPEALEDHARGWRALSGAVLAAAPTRTGATLTYRLDQAVVEALLELIEAERRCCPDLAFEATLTVVIEAPEEMRDWVASTFAPEAHGSQAAAPDKPVNVDAIQEAVRVRYAAAAQQGSDCPPCGKAETQGIGASVYEPDDRDGLPEQVLLSSIGCANPVAVADLAAGEVVLDLGSGGGTDALLSARRVGPTGKVYGLDMTDEMLDLARRNQADAGIDNVEFLRGHIEAIPLPDESVDVVLSNCVIGLSPAKGEVFAEVYRVLRPGGRLALADVVADVPSTPEQQADVESWVSCLAGSFTRPQYLSALQAAGFTAMSIDESHPVADGSDSVIVRARKPSR